MCVSVYICNIKQTKKNRTIDIDLSISIMVVGGAKKNEDFIQIDKWMNVEFKHQTNWLMWMIIWQTN